MSNYVPPPPSSGVGAPRSTRATTILVVGILGVVCCQLCGPVAWYMGRDELAKIQAGLVSTLDEGTAKAGMILGIVATILLGLGLLWMVFFGGLAFLSALAGQSSL